MKLQVVANEYDDWAASKFIEYASTSVTWREGTLRRLVFGKYLQGNFKVALGYETLYEGASFANAAAAFNTNA